MSIVRKWVEIGTKVLKEESGYAIGARFNNIMIVSVWYMDHAVDIGAVGEVINFTGRMMNVHAL